jgi:hypothetical protein
MTYLAASMTYRNEALYLREWIEFHLLVGVEHFFLYDNGSTDEHADILDSYVRRGIVTVEEWPGERRQHEAIDHCLATRTDVRWIAFIDADEFLFSPRGRPVPEVLRDFEEFPGVGVNLAQFGTSGHQTRPEGLLIENYLYRATNPDARWVKCVVQPARTQRCRGVHVFEYTSGHGVDVAKRPLDGWLTQSYIKSRLRINHYYTKSLEELHAKYSRTRADTGKLREPLDMSTLRRLEARYSRDETILQYVPALKQRLSG